MKTVGWLKQFSRIWLFSHISDDLRHVIPRTGRNRDDSQYKASTTYIDIFWTQCCHIHTPWYAIEHNAERHLTGKKPQSYKERAGSRTWWATFLLYGKDEFKRIPEICTIDGGGCRSNENTAESSDTNG